jgi:hypothetical protein
MMLLLAFCGGLAVAQAQDESGIAAVINRQHAVNRLIGESIASRQIDLASHHQVQAKRGRWFRNSWQRWIIPVARLSNRQHEGILNRR